MKKKHKRPWGVFLAIIAAVIFGSLVGEKGAIFGLTFYSIVDALGTVFLNALTLVVVPLVVSSIITGIAKIGGDKDFGRLGAKMFTFYLGTSLLAILIGLFFVNLIGPGYSDIHAAVSDQELTQIQTAQDLLNQKGGHFASLLNSAIPANIVKSLAEGNMLGIIFFSMIFGYAITKIDSHSASGLKNFFQGTFETMIQFTHMIMKVLPFGVFCLVSKVFMTTGFESLNSVALLFATVILSLSVFMFVGLPLLLKFIAKVKPMRHFKAMSPALITAFSTSSSSATLPVTIDCVEKRAKVSNRICSLVVPLGTSINMSGSALYECVAAMFVAQVYGIELSFLTQFVIVLMSLIASFGVAGIPSASLVAVLLILRVIGLPMEGVGLFVAIDRVLDMCRTTVNVFSDSCCAVLVARTEGEKGILATDVYEDL
jgi:proton glutamate symport protein